MSTELINRSSDLSRLRDEGYEIRISGAHLIVSHIPYVNASQKVAYGIIVVPLAMSGNLTAKPSNHQVYFHGEEPFKNNGKPIDGIGKSPRSDIMGGLRVNFALSCKPSGGYTDYYHMLSTYISIISDEAKALDKNATAHTFRVQAPVDDGSVFQYPDSNSARAQIDIATAKLEGHRVGIVGMGGTGSYLLDLVAKTPVAEIHIFDGDDFLQHNAFRAPGAPSIERLVSCKKKVEYFQDIYSKMHKSVVAHPYFIGEENIAQLADMDYIFLSVDRGSVRQLISEYLEAKGISFIDVGIGVQLVDSYLRGTVRVTASRDGMRAHFPKKVSFSDEGENAYSTNIQIADLNMLNAAFAVIEWKKSLGFYWEDIKTSHSTFTITTNQLISDEHTC